MLFELFPNESAIVVNTVYIAKIELNFKSGVLT